jgi:hypothetical protein
MSKILAAGETGFGIMIESDSGYVSTDLNVNLINEGFVLKPNEPVLINCILQKYGVKNKNGRIYPKDVLVPQVNEYQKLVDTNDAASECFTPDTKILTKDGWKLIKNISENEEILTLNRETRKTEYQKITKKINDNYVGDIYHVKSNSIDIKVTPNHRFIIENSKGELIEKTAFELFDNVENNTYLNSEYKLLKNSDYSQSNSEYIGLDKRFLKIKKINYSGNIVCVKVPNETIYVMRNGKSLWTLNSDHPENSVISLQNISHMITKMWWGTGDQENVLFGELKIIVSPGFIKFGVCSLIGDKIVVYLQNKMRIGISSRGVGTLKEINGENLVQADFELIGFDLVKTPSTPGGYLFPKSEKFGENYVNKNGIYLKEENKKIINAIDKFLL